VIPVARIRDLFDDVWRQWAYPDSKGKLWAGGLSTLEDVRELLDVELPSSGVVLSAEEVEQLRIALTWVPTEYRRAALALLDGADEPLFDGVYDSQPDVYLGVAPLLDGADEEEAT